MPGFHPKSLAQCAYGLVFLAGVCFAVADMSPGHYVRSLIFLAVWPGILTSFLFLLFGVRSPGMFWANLGKSFLFGELTFCAWLLWALIVGLGIGIAKALAQFLVPAGIALCIYVAYKLRHAETVYMVEKPKTPAVPKSNSQWLWTFDPNFFGTHSPKALVLKTEDPMQDRRFEFAFENLHEGSNRHG